MVALPRHFLIALLIVLQLIAPLVHAHIGNEGAMVGLHWQAAETLSLSDQVSFVKTAHHCAIPGAIVELGSAIEPSSSTPDVTSWCLLLSAAFLILMAPQSQRLKRLLPAIVDSPSPPTRAHSPRSPPLQS